MLGRPYRHLPPDPIGFARLAENPACRAPSTPRNSCRSLDRREGGGQGDTLPCARAFSLVFDCCRARRIRSAAFLPSGVSGYFCKIWW